MVIVKDNQVIGEWYFGKPKTKIHIMSCTKSVVNLAVGRLIDAGKIRSLDQPVYEFYPEWQTGSKKLITIRSLLNHTSGLQNVPNATIEIKMLLNTYPRANVIKLALAAELSDAPGSRFSYNNKAVNLLAGIIQVFSRAIRAKAVVHFSITRHIRSGMLATSCTSMCPVAHK